MGISTQFLRFVSDLAAPAGRAGTISENTLPKVAVDLLASRLKAADRKAARATLNSRQRKRYIVAAPLHQQSSGPVTMASLRAVHDALAGSDSVVRSENETGRKVLRLTGLEAAVLRERFTGLLVEDDVQYAMARSPLLADVQPISVSSSRAQTLRVEVRGNGAPLPDAHVVLLTDVATNSGYEGQTGADGAWTVPIRKGDTKFERVVVEPRSGYWSRIWRNRKAASPLTLDVSPLAVAGFDWGHVATQAKSQGRYRPGSFLGETIKVAIIDSGIAPHSSLNVRDGRNFIEGEDAGRWANDDSGHGTHCAGVVAAAMKQGSVWGYAPAATLFAGRVFGGPDGGGFASDIGDAIEWAVNQGCDIISLSLESGTASSFIRSKIEKAIDAGVLCLAATGNAGGAVSYPARFRGVAAVSAIGKFGTYPGDSVHSDAESKVRSSDGQYYLASFSNYGEEVDFCAPGVAITSTLPADVYSAWDGTSMACPHVAGIAALALQASPQILASPRDSTRMGLLLERVGELCVDLGLGRQHQGRGLPDLSRL